MKDFQLGFSEVRALALSTPSLFPEQSLPGQVMILGTPCAWWERWGRGEAAASQAASAGLWAAIQVIEPLVLRCFREVYGLLRGAWDAFAQILQRGHDPEGPCLGRHCSSLGPLLHLPPRLQSTLADPAQPPHQVPICASFFLSVLGSKWWETRWPRRERTCFLGRLKGFLTGVGCVPWVIMIPPTVLTINK